MSPGHEAAVALLAVVLLAAIGCAKGASEPATSTGGTPDLDPKAQLTALMQEVYLGKAGNKDRLVYLRVDEDPEGGYRVAIEFNADDLGSVESNRVAMDARMRDAYAALFASGLDVKDAFMSARARMITGRGREEPTGGSGYSYPVVYKTWMSREIAETVDWESKSEIDFNDVWKVLILNHAFR